MTSESVPRTIMITFILLSLFCHSSQDGNTGEPGMTHSRGPGVYPRDQAFEVGSRATFYCVLPAGGTFTHMYLVGYNRSDGILTQINNQTYSLTLVLNRPSSPSGTDVKCGATVEHRQRDDGATAFIGYPPDDKELQCETTDLESVECHWTVGGATHLLTPTAYQLLGSAYTCQSGKCWGKEDVSAGERSWKLRAHNQLGTVELTDTADLMTRVHMRAPESVRAWTVNPRDVSLKWSWKVQGYKDLNLTCEVNLSHAGTQCSQKPNSGVGLDFAVLMNLIPNWSYNVTVRCRTTQHSWKWSDWSSTFNFRTKGDVPDALDVWMKMKDDEILIIWKILLGKQSHGHVLDYTVTWSKINGTEQHNTTTVTHNHFQLRLDTTQQYVVNVTARNVNGSSSPSTIITPSSSSAGLDPTTVKASRMAGSGGGFNLSWSSSPAASCGYIVDWRPSSGHSMVTWIKVPQTNVFLKNLREGQRYSMSISACTRGAALLLETREGYVQEQRIRDHLFKALKWKQKGSDVEVSWDRISLNEQTAFIQGYVLEWSDRDEQDNNVSTVHSVSTDEPTSTRLTASDLKTSSYTFTVTARTALGGCRSKHLIVHVNPRTGNSLGAVVVSLVAVFGLLTLLSVVCYRQWACIKQKVYPPIPRPLLTDTWLRSTGDHRLHVDPGPSEVDLMDAPPLLCKAEAPPPPNLIPPPRSLPAPSGFPPSPFRGAFQNLSYDLMMQTEDQQPPTRPPLVPAQEQPGSHMTCDLTYILVPRPTSPEHLTNISDTETS